MCGQQLHIKFTPSVQSCANLARILVMIVSVALKHVLYFLLLVAQMKKNATQKKHQPYRTNVDNVL